MTITYIIENLHLVAQQILLNTNSNKVIIFNANMGVGKTTLIKELVFQLGVSDLASSPTFSIVNEYEGKDQTKIYHFDLYRLNSETEAYDMGIEEYLYSNNYCFIEWPEKASNLIPEKHSAINIIQLPGGERELTIQNF
jgi:tRNA threonylcarbamoyladenosine biosynthesis protein TsaE